MVRGVVNDRLEAIVLLSVIGPSSRTREIEAVIDTGFNGFLFLPAELAEDLDLEFAYTSPVVLADGTTDRFNVFNVMVMWDNQPKHVLALASQGAPLVGMGLLHHHSLYVEVVEGGQIIILASE